MGLSRMLELEDAREYALTVFKTCKEVVAVNLVWRELDKLPYFGYAIEATFVDGTIGRLVTRRDPFPLPLFVQYNPGDFDENCLWMNVVKDYLWRDSLRKIGFLKLLGDTFKFIGIPSNLTSRDLDELRVELDLKCLDR